MNRPAFGFIASTVLLAGCAADQLSVATAEPPTPPIGIGEIVSEFRTYRAITEQPVYVDLALAMSCRGASGAQIADAQARKGPHANTRIMIYMNESAAATFARGGNLTYEPGAVIVKDKIEALWGAHPGVGGMVKRPKGFDPTHGDWEYFYFETPANIDHGRIASCVACHAQARASDHVFGTWRTK